MSASTGNNAVNQLDSESEDEQMPLASTQTQAPSSPELTDLSLAGVWRHTKSTIDSSPAFQHSTGPARIALCATFIGLIFGVGTQWALLTTNMRQVGLYLMMMAIFHFLEFIWTAVCHPQKISAQAFLLNHSREYHGALAAGLIEFILESYFFPSLKYPSSPYIMWFGLIIVGVGQFVRTLAMFTAASNFTHLVAEYKTPNHKLVTHGIYSLCRHPSYAGWFWWSVGTQILLANPICTVVYAIVSFLFFRGRINHEERNMLGFWGDEYAQYQKRVPSGVPFIKGCIATQ